MNAQRAKRETAEVAADLVDYGLTVGLGSTTTALVAQGESVDRMDFPTTLVTDWSTKGNELVTHEYTKPRCVLAFDHSAFIRVRPDRCVAGRSEALDQIADDYPRTVAVFVT
jgi:hypothetical protein